MTLHIEKNSNSINSWNMGKCSVYLYFQSPSVINMYYLCNSENSMNLFMLIEALKKATCNSND